MVDPSVPSFARGTAPLLYCSRFTVAPGALARYDEWFVCHAESLLGAGFQRVHGYRSSRARGELCNLYEIPGVEVFGEGYAAAREADTLGVEVRKLLTPAVLAVYQQLEVEGRVGPVGDGSIALLEVTPGPGGIDPSDPVRRWLADGELARLAGVPDVSSARLCAAVPSPVTPAPEATLCVMVECAEPEVAHSVEDGLAGRLAAATGATVDPGRGDVLTPRRSYGVGDG